MPELYVTDSSEALLTGRKPPFRLVAIALNSNNGITSASANLAAGANGMAVDGAPNAPQGAEGAETGPVIAYAVSEEFVVRRGWRAWVWACQRCHRVQL